ncbi:TPA: hypothetical protein ACLGWU_000925 [Salmonella enterica]
MNKLQLFALISTALIGTANAELKTATATAHLTVEGNMGIALKAEPMAAIPAGQTAAETPVAKFVISNTGDSPFLTKIMFDHSAPCPDVEVCFVDGQTNFIPLKPDLSSGFWSDNFANGLASTKTVAAKSDAPAIVLLVKGNQTIQPGDYTLTATAAITSN